MDAFDADVIIYAATASNPHGRRIRALFEAAEADDGSHTFVGVGSVLLVPETLTHPTRHGNNDELSAIEVLLARLDLRPVDEATAVLAVAMGAAYGLRAADAVHLATAVAVGADRFITNNKNDFPQSITEIDVTYPGDLPEA